ncbi:endoglucanase 18 isoform X2 [Selaginella moellendorffii]|uniref:endoglucanase 18 isoform X2 n=1 Tax=Selaginella moellendorffii TaxID=88036 RepID=UPI000D1C8D1D|nr:endoglucanase 18 isoform X2 [Selaginella moellendorffii]|eukprot:XP_024526139.1 endoglucanase 18 isoform X2 [Selaginella moellendorffii]
MAFSGLFLELLALVLVLELSHCLDYSDALSKSILFFEAQRSGPLPSSQRQNWRGDSGLYDGAAENVDLVGGYYDAGDNVKYLFPMAFTITMLSWGAIEYGNSMAQLGELQNVLDAIRWGTDFMIKANTGPTTLWVQESYLHDFLFLSLNLGLTMQVGDPRADHNCWERPEDMDTDRQLYKVDENNPGTEIAAETAAALAASSIVLSGVDPGYSNFLLRRAEALFEFANQYRGSFWKTCPFYCSFNGFHDELLWAAAWLFKATNAASYLDFIERNMDKSVPTSEFSWDNKHAGVQVLLSNESLAKFKDHADRFFCSVLPYSPVNRVSTTPGGMMFVRTGANMQYVTSTSFLAAVFGDYLQAATQTLACQDYIFAPDTLMSFALNQVNYILGQNPLGMSYMVGYSNYYPLEPHHRGASIVSIYEDSTPVNCVLGFNEWFYRPFPNPNVLTGAIVGGPDRWDAFLDWRPNSAQLEPTTYINAPFVGLLARICSLYNFF